MSLALWGIYVSRPKIVGGSCFYSCWFTAIVNECDRATVEVALLDVVRRPEGRAHWRGGKQLRIITGMGNNSKDKEAVIKVTLSFWWWWWWYCCHGAVMVLSFAAAAAAAAAATAAAAA